MNLNNTSGEIKSFRRQGKIYDIPSDKADAFRSKYPDAEEVSSFDVDGTVYDIPIQKTDSFLAKYPNAVKYGQQPVQQTEQPVQEQQRPTSTMSAFADMFAPKKKEPTSTSKFADYLAIVNNRFYNFPADVLDTYSIASSFIENKLSKIGLGKETKPEDILALKKWETENELELQKLNQAELQSYLLDAQSARQMQIAALGQEDLFSKRFVYYLATAWSVATMAYIGCITFVRIPAENIRYADTVLAFLLGTAVAQIFNYMYGTTRGSEAKNAVIKDVVQSSLK